MQGLRLNAIAKRNLSYKKCLREGEIDSSALIILCIQLLNGKIDQLILNEIRNLFIICDYDGVKDLILKTINDNKDAIEIVDSGLVDLIHSAFTKAEDKPEENYSRRYFEYKLSVDMWDSLESHHFTAIQRLLKAIKNHNMIEILALENDIQNLEQQIQLSELMLGSNLTSNELTTITRTRAVLEDFQAKLKSLISIEAKLPAAVNNIDEAKIVISVIRDLGDANRDLLNRIITPLRLRSALATTKDRGAQLISDPKHSSYIIDPKNPNYVGPQYSIAPSILRARSPLPRDEFDVSLPAKVNRIPDIFSINRSIQNGFSSSRPYIPFVNSVSGTAYSMAAAIKVLLEQHDDNPVLTSTQLNAEVNILIHAWISFTCMNGYHSFGEMIAVLNDPEIIGLLASHNIRIENNFNSKKMDELFALAAEYTSANILRKISTKDVTEKHKEKLTDGWNLHPLDHAEYIQKLKDPYAVILLDTPHAIIQNSRYDQTDVGEICELVGNYHLLDNVMFSPERLALFHTTAFIQTELARDPEAPYDQRRPEDDLEKMVLEEFYPKILAELHDEDIATEIELIDKNIDNFLDNILNSYIQGFYTDEVRAQIDSPVMLEVLEFIDNIINHYESREKKLHESYKQAYQAELLRLNAIDPAIFAIEIERLNHLSVFEYNDELQRLALAFPKLGIKSLDERNLRVLGHYKSNVDLIDTLRKALHTKLYNQMMDKKIQEVVDSVANKIVNKKGYQRMLPPESSSERHTFIVTGAPTSGKEVAVAQAATDAYEFSGIDWRKVCKINTDDHSAIVSHGQSLTQDARNHAQLSRLESQKIREIAAKRYEQKIKSGNAPHLLIDSILPEMKYFDIGLKHDGNVHLYTVTSSVEKSITKMIDRGQQTGAYVSTDFMLSSHKNVSKLLIKNIIDLAQKGLSVDFSLYDGESFPGRRIFYGNTGAEEMVVIDKKKAAYFYGKSAINEKSRRPEELYRDPITHAALDEYDDSYKTLLTDAGFSVKSQTEIDIDIAQFSQLTNEIASSDSLLTPCTISYEAFCSFVPGYTTTLSRIMSTPTQEEPRLSASNKVCCLI